MITFLKEEKRVWWLALVVILFLVGILLGKNLGSVSEVTQEVTHEEITISLEESLIRASEKVSPAVVNIRTVQLARDSFFRTVPREGQGSGVIFSEEGHILTNDHVIQKAREIKVVLPDGREIEGELTGSDPSVDLAVVKIKAKNLPVAKLGDSDKLKPGEFCIAIGNPFGLQNTLTFGVISAVGRSIGAAPGKILENLIQTDALRWTPLSRHEIAIFKILYGLIILVINIKVHLSWCSVIQ